MHARVKTNGGMVVIARFETLPRRKRRPQGSMLDMRFWSIFLKHIIFSKKTGGDGVKNRETVLRQRPKISHFWDTAGYRKPLPPYVSPLPILITVYQLLNWLRTLRVLARLPLFHQEGREQ